MKFTRRNFVMFASALEALVSGGYASPAMSQDGPLKVAFVYVGPIGDA